MTSSMPSTAVATESIKIDGFNLGTNATIQDEKETPNSITLSASGALVSIGSMTSGKWTLKVGDITAINNLNNNDAHGYFSGTTTEAIGDKEIYSNYYNRKPNGYNNNLLTDDLEFDVWEFDSSAAVPITGQLEQPQMKINPKTGRISFAYVNGPLYFSMGGNDTSYDYYLGGFDFFTSTGYAIDSEGNTYGVCAGGDINATEASKFQFMTGSWGTGYRNRYGEYCGRQYIDGNRPAKPSLRLESVGQKDANGNNTFQKQRFKSPSIATSVVSGSGNTATTNVYMAYYDDLNAEIRFKYGQLTNSGTCTDFGNFKDSNNFTGLDTYDNIANVQVVAKAGTARLPGSYVSIDVTKTGGDKVVMVWYDETTRCLWYSYNTTPTTDRKNTTDYGGWSTPVAVFSETSEMANAGEYCQIAVDVSGGIHIAAYDPMNLDLVYAYASSYAVTTTSQFSSCMVDSEGVIGSNLTLDVAKLSASGKAIPHIGYYATTAVRPKYAYMVSTSDHGDSGAENDMFTQKWECGIVPTPSIISQHSAQYNKINVGVFQKSGVICNSTDITNTTSTSNVNNQSGGKSDYGAQRWGHAYGNGTSNAVLGYAIKINSSSDAIETAQMR